MSQGPGSWKGLLVKHWRNRGFWGWFWREQIPLLAKITLLGLVVSGLAAAGVWGAASLGNGSSSADRKSVLVPAGSPDHGRRQTASRIQKLTRTGQPAVTDGRVRLAPALKRSTSTIVSTNYVTNQQTVTNQKTVTNQQTVVKQRTVTAAKSPSKTLVSTQTETVMQTQTVAEILTLTAVTVTAPVTVTVTQPVTVTVTGPTGGG